MKALAKRLDRLEVGQPILSPSVKQWLGWELTETERAALDGAGRLDPGTIDTSYWSREAKVWLGIV